MGTEFKTPCTQYNNPSGDFCVCFFPLLFYVYMLISLKKERGGGERNTKQC